MKRLLSLSLVVCGIAVGFSCGFAPSATVPQIHAYDYFADFLHRSNVTQESTEQRKAIGTEMENFPGVLTFPKNALVLFDMQATEPGPDDLFYHAGNGEFVLLRDLYLTNDGDTTLLSLDGRNWFSSDRDKSKDHENLITRVYYYPKKETNRLYVPFTWSAKLDPELVYYWKDRPRKVREMKAGDVISSAKAERITLDLRNDALLLHAGTKARLSLNIEGNIFVARNHGTGFAFVAVRDFYFYRSAKLPTVSFDGKDWGNFPWQFSFEMYNESVATGGDSLDFTFNVKLFRL